jgi:4-methylaminobutanoate oxidase (formaldehyde-forming)
MTRINKYSAELYATLEKETGHPTGWKQVGSLIAGKSEARMIQLQRTAAMAELFGVDVHLIDRDAALQKWPLLRVDDLLGAAWLPHDGKVIPKEVCLAMAKGAEKHGAQIIEHVRVDQLEQEEGAVSGVVTNLGRIRCEHVVLCGGMWTREIALRCGITVPLYPVEHHYIVSEPIQGAFDELPVGRDPDLCIYFRGEGDAVMLGAFQKYTKPWKVDRVPDDFSFKLLEPDWQKYQEPLAAGKWRIPALENAKFAKFVNGPESFTPDNNFIMGEAPEVRNLFVVAGLNSVGIASAGGAGKYLAEWLLEGQPTMDLWSVDIRRFGRFANNLSFLRERVTEVLGLHYQMAWPNREFETGRGLRKTAIHERLAVGGASFGAKNGWERPNWFARDGMKAQTDYSFGRQNWFECHAAEHRAARESVAIFDQSGFSKLRCQGPDALPLLQQLCGNDMDVEAGRIVYTGMFNKRGGFESDLTVVRLRNEVFYIITGTAQAVHDMDWLRRNVATGERVEITDVTESFGVLGVMGPNSRELLQSLSDSDLSNAAFPFGTARQISLGTATALALRITYVGELGWELHVPISQLALLYDTLMEAGKKFGITNAGHYAINSLRLEKGYRAWGADISPDDTPLEADLAFVITWDKDIPFIGRQSLLKQKANGLTRRLVTFVLQDPEPVLWGSEPIYRNGQPVGYTTSGSYGHTLGAAIGMGYVRNQAGVTPDFIRAGKYEIGVNGRRYPATPHLRAPYDPERKRILS